MADVTKNLEVCKCRNCGEDFLKRKKKRTRGIHMNIRSSKSITCSKKCSTIYNHNQKKHDRKKRNKK